VRPRPLHGDSKIKESSSLSAPGSSVVMMPLASKVSVPEPTPVTWFRALCVRLCQVPLVERDSHLPIASRSQAWVREGKTTRFIIPSTPTPFIRLEGALDLWVVLQTEPKWLMWIASFPLSWPDVFQLVVYSLKQSLELSHWHHQVS